MARIAQEMRVSPEVMARYEPVIGLEVHAQLKTQTKAFCGCSTRFGDAPNKNTCPVCLGFPGALPVLNRKAVELAVRASLALQARVHERSRFARKNYFYPDLPKGYQISMYELPLATGGALEIEIEGRAKKIGITRLHMEEDAAKNLHEGFPDSDKWSYIDFNRGGVPLVEIVSEPDIRTPSEAYQYLNTLKQVLEYTDVSDCNMEEGSLRCDANVSVRPRGEAKFGTKVEVKNLNSFHDLEDALEFEIERQVSVLESGGKVSQETRLWNVGAARTESMRSKEFAHDYRYFPEPDLLPAFVSEGLIVQLAAEMPEMPSVKKKRFTRDYGITPYDADVLTASRDRADYFEAVVHGGVSAKTAANWISGELLRRLNDAGKDIGDSFVATENFADLLRRIENGEITSSNAKQVFAEMVHSGKNASQIIQALGLSRVFNDEVVSDAVLNTLLSYTERLDQIHKGKTGTRKSLIGEAMKLTRGRVDPKMVTDELNKALDLYSARLLNTSSGTSNVFCIFVAQSTILAMAAPPTALTEANINELIASLYPEVLRRPAQSGAAGNSARTNTMTVSATNKMAPEE